MFRGERGFVLWVAHSKRRISAVFQRVGVGFVWARDPGTEERAIDMFCGCLRRWCHSLGTSHCQSADIPTVSETPRKPVWPAPEYLGGGVQK